MIFPAFKLRRDTHGTIGEEVGEYAYVVGFHEGTPCEGELMKSHDRVQNDNWNLWAA